MSINETYVMSTLSEASYADFRRALQPDGSFSVNEVKAALIGDANFSEVQATAFVTQWRVVDHQPNTLDGFSATLFEKLDVDQQGTGKYTLAVRGTEIDDPRDLVVDAFLAQGWVPQKGALNSYYERLVAEGILSAGQSIAVTGHSLGGFLAQIFATEHPDVVARAYTYNAPGRGGVYAQALEELGLAAEQVDDSRITNVYAEPGSELTAGLGTVFGSFTPVFIEESSISASNHRIGRLTDALAVYDLFGLLSPSASLMDVTGILEASSGTPSTSLEVAVSSLGRLFRVSGAEPIVEDRETLYAAVTAIRNAIVDQDTVTAGTAVILDLSADEDPGQLAANARNSIGFRYALLHLDPFALLNVDELFGPHNLNGELDLYDPVTRSGRLTDEYLRDRAAFLHAKLAFGTADTNPQGPELIEYRDSSSDVSVTVYTAEGMVTRRIFFGSVDNDEFTDGGAKADRFYGGGGNDTFQGKGGDDHLEGGIGHDRYIYNTGDGRDTIFDQDGDGAIVVDGAELTGGSKIGDGLWASADGEHVYGFDGDLVSGGTLVIDDGLRILGFRNGDLGIVLGDPSPPALVGTVLQGIELNDALHFVSQLTRAEYEVRRYDPVSAVGEEGDDWLGTGDGDDMLDGGDGNDWQLAYEGDDVLIGGPGHDALFPGEGSNWVDAGTGDDVVISSHYLLFDTTSSVDWDEIAWRDVASRVKVNVLPDLYWNEVGEASFRAYGEPPSEAFTAPSLYSPTFRSVANAEVSYSPVAPTQLTYKFVDDSVTVLEFGWQRRDTPDSAPNWFSGGEGDDLLVGNNGGDILIGGDDNDRLAGEAGADQLLGGDGDDQLLGQQDDDLLDGGTGNDKLLGGSGNDLILGGAGNDEMWGDSGDKMTGGDDHLEGGAGDDQIGGDGGDDRLDGGAGNDILEGDVGSDLLLGGAGEDILFGGTDNDRLFGGGDADELYGNGGDDELHGGLGADSLWGGDGNDRLDGGSDQAPDLLYGGAGDDTFVWRAGAGRDVLVDAAADDTVRLDGLWPGALSTDVVQSVDGTDYLRITLNPDDVLLVRGGPSNGPERYEFGDGSILSRSEFLARTMGVPLNYRLAESGALSGGSANDLLVGSGENDELLGHSGSDILVGAAGDDRLVGGDGDDEYRIGPGTGFDRIDEALDEISVLRLLAGATVNDLGFSRRGEDLWIGLQDGRSGALLEGFFQRNQLWSVEDEDGGRLILTRDSVPGLDEAPPVTRSLDELRAQFVAAIHAAYGQVLRINGYEQGEDGLWRAEFRNGNWHDNYTLAFDSLVESDVGDYTRSVRTVTSSVLSTSSKVEPTTTTIYGDGGVRVSDDWGRVEILTEDAFSGYDGVRIDGAVVPIYGVNRDYDPLTGQFDRELTGYMVFPNGVPEVTTQTRDVLHTYRERRTSVNIVDVTLGGGDDRFERDSGYYDTFNVVDGGAGNDRISAGGDRAYLYRESVSVPGRDYWPLTQLPGSFLYGNSGDDTLYGGYGEDVLIGGVGDDELRGGMGDDTYLLEGGGSDRMFEDGWDDGRGSDILCLPADIAFDDLTFTWGEVIQQSLYMYEAPKGSAFTSATWNTRLASSHAALTMQWSVSDGVTVVLPHSDQKAGYGVDYVAFGDGTQMAFSALLETAGFTGDVDPHFGDNTLTGSGYLWGGPGNDVLQGQSSAAEGFLSQTILVGGQGRDTLLGGDGNDLLLGNDIVGDYSWDFLAAITSPGDEQGNVYDGGRGNDEIWGTAGSDVFLFGLGDGRDEIRDWLHYHLGYPNAFNLASLDPSDRALFESSSDVLRFDESIKPVDILVSRRYESLVFQHVNGSDRVEFLFWFSAELNQLSQVEFADGTVWDRAFIESRIDAGPLTNPPVVGSVLPDEIATNEDSPFNLSIPADAFIDPDGDSLTLSVETFDGSPLPSWLVFDAANRTLSGVPLQDHVGEVGIRVVATDPAGASAYQDITVTVLNVNDAPSVSGSISAQTSVEGEAYVLSVPDSLFTDVDPGDSLILDAMLSDGTPLPAWLEFDPTTLRFSGTPAAEDIGELEARLVATDLSGESAEVNFGITVEAATSTNTAPVLVSPIGDQVTDEDASFSFLVPVGTFSDADAGDVLSYRAVIPGTDSLSSWLTFDSTTRTFSGIPDNGDVGVLSIEVTAEDSVGAAVSDVFSLTVNNVNDTPVLAQVIDDQASEEGTPFSFQMSAATFLDPDVGDELVYTARLADGGTLPVWLSFDPLTLTFSGTPDAAGVGIQTIRVSATDQSGAMAVGDFTLEVSAAPGNGEGEVIEGTSSDETLYGGTGDDVILGGWGDDTIYGGGGDDTIHGEWGFDTLYGESGNDVFVVEGNSNTSHFDVVYGGDGFDTIAGGIGDDELRIANLTDVHSIEAIDGGAGYNRVQGGGSNGTIDLRSVSVQNIDEINGGGGKDTIYGTDAGDRIVGGSGNDILYGEGGDDTFVVTGWASGGHDEFWGGEGTDTLLGGAGDDSFRVESFSIANSVEIIDGQGGYNAVTGTGAHQTIDLRGITVLNVDELNGSGGNDTLYGSDSGERLVGANGNDTLYGGAGTDTYVFTRNDDQDTVVNANPIDVGTGQPEASDDVLRFEGDIAHEQLWFERVGNDLAVSVIGTSDEVTVQGWYDGAASRLDRLETETGYLLYDDQVEQLVSAMSSFAPPASGQLTLPEELDTELRPVITAAWQTSA